MKLGYFEMKSLEWIYWTEEWSVKTLQRRLQYEDIERKALEETIKYEDLGIKIKTLNEDIRSKNNVWRP